MSVRAQRSHQRGLTYIEVMIAAVLIAVTLAPAVEALYTGMLGADVYEAASAENYAALALMEEILAQPFSSLVAAAAVAGDPNTPTSYSDAPGTPNRRLVFLAPYDAENADGDDDIFTVTDPNLDGDSNPYTGYAGLLWVNVAVEGSITSLASLTVR